TSSGGWDDILDDMVYRRNALRMPFSYQGSNCCFDLTCIKCKGLNKVVIPRPYTLKFILDGSGEFKDHNLSTYKILKLCSIRLKKKQQLLSPNWKNISNITEIQFKKTEKLKSIKHLGDKWDQLLS